MSLLTYIENHPAIAFVVGGVHIALAKWIHTIEVPTIVMQIFQLGAWTVTIFVGCLTIYGFFKKKKK